MTATAAQISEVRRMVAEPLTTAYSDASITTYIERYPLLDECGEPSFYWNAASIPPTQLVNASWIPTYDLHAAAGDIWQEKAANLAADFDFQADGGNYSRSQAYEHALGQARYHNSRRSPRTATLQQWPKENRVNLFPWIGNLPELDI